MRGGSLQNQDAGKRPIFRLTELCSSICIRTFAYFYDDTNFVPVFCPNQKKLRSQNASCHHQQARVNYKLWILYISNSISTTTPAKFFDSNNTLLLWEGSYKEMFRHASVLHYFQMLFNLRYTIETKSPTVFCPLPNDCTYKLLQQQWLLLTHLFEQVGNMLHFALSNWLRRLQKVLFLFSRWISQSTGPTSVGHFSSVKDEFKN